MAAIQWCHVIGSSRYTDIGQEVQTPEKGASELVTNKVCRTTRRRTDSMGKFAYDTTLIRLVTSGDEFA